MTTPTFTTPPTAPIRGDATTFSSRFASWLAWIATFTGELVTGVGWMATTAAAVTADASIAAAAADAAIGASGYMGTTAATLNLATGSQSFTIAQAGLSFAAGQQVALILLSDDSVRMTGTLSSYTAGSGAAQVTITRFSGAVASGAGWAMILKALEGLSPEQVDSRAISYALVL